MSQNAISEYDIKGDRYVSERSLKLHRHQQTKRWVAGLLLVLCVSILVFSIFLTSHRPAPYPVRYAIKGQATKDPALYRQVDLLRRQFHALITGSIESKLRRIEASLRRGTVQTADLETLRSLQQDLKVLKNYSFFDSSRSVTAQQSPAAVQAGSTPANLLNDEHVLSEIAYMKNLLYVSIASCGVVCIGIGGLWLRSSSALKKLDSKSFGSRLLLEKPNSADHS